MKKSTAVILFKVVLFIVVLYAFLFSIQLMGSAFKLLGKGFAETLIQTTSNPFVGLLIGILVTSIIQSSSTTTSIAVASVAGGILTLRGAIPIIMGANIGTTITNTIVAIGHITRKQEFERAFAAATVHDFFNILAVLVFFPLEMTTHFLEKSAVFLAGLLDGMGGIKFLSPLKAITTPLITLVEDLLPIPAVLIGLSLAILFFSLVQMVKIMRSLMMSKIEVYIDRFLFKNDLTAFLLAMTVTAVIQSSSVTTSLVIPLVGAGLLTIRKIFPFMLGANIGTTVTAILASFATLNPVAITVAFTHLLFNMSGIIVFYPLRRIPIFLAESLAKITSKSKRNTILFVVLYFALYLVPLIFIL
ncbi:MAG: Na/Pi symporter [Acidobacteria bacterium]|nr:Na/Pi symporter [Acidobacteriota bacterium]MCG2816179.1 Na/Pi symporter [Candidatus Aminicenantes bacterium]MBU1475273.1 Na/Pi symporter [Acidobacteriota bacterium]MBU4254613.1 Na/Pi symporter [Acidobacteriota bacterium]MBU4329922.1 Na/Pi symporter [Acidobacteriota bacterium]